MDENSYEYECMRAELLGVEKPSLDEFERKQKMLEKEKNEQEEVEIENLKEIEKDTEENLKHISGGFHELNNILTSTQKKLNRFKASCGSLTNLLKIKIGNISGSGESTALSSSSNNGQEMEGLDNSSLSCSPKKEKCDSDAGDSKKSDLARALDNNVDKLDRLIDQADQSHCSMAEQNKQMKKFLR